MILTVNALTKRYGETEETIPAVDGCSFSLQKQAFIGIRGQSGCGKTTLLRMLALQLAPSAGTILFDGENPWCQTEKQRAHDRNSRIGYIPQNFALIPILTVEENITLPYLIARKSVDRERLQMLMERLQITSCRHQYPSELSGGQKQRCAVARALLQNAKLLLADEPTSNLDDTCTAAVLSLLSDFRENGGSILRTTHDARLLKAVDRVWTMENGLLNVTGL